MKINTFDSIAKSSLDEWIYYLKTGELPETYHAKGLKQVEEKLKLEKMEPAARKQYNKHLKEIGLSRSAWETALYEGERKGLEKGLEKGRIKEKREIVLSSFKKGHSVELIAEIVGITIEDVHAIVKEG